MRVKSLLAVCATVIVMAGAGTAAAAPCAGFADVDDTSSFCPNVEWLKNRSITLGCTSPMQFCPDDAVNRLQMAVFMNRLATALTPIELTPVSAIPAALLLSSEPVICATADFVVTGFPRRAYVNTAALLSAPTGDVSIGAWAVFSTNAGVTWLPVPYSWQFATLYVAFPGNRSSLAPFGYVDLNVGQSVRFGVQIFAIGGPGNVVTASCQNSVRVANRNASSSPLDPAAAPGGT